MPLHDENATIGGDLRFLAAPPRPDLFTLETNIPYLKQKGILRRNSLMMLPVGVFDSFNL